MMTAVWGYVSRTYLVSSRPSMPGSLMSNKTISGWSAAISSRASRPFPASPAIWKLDSVSNVSRSPAREIG